MKRKGWYLVVYDIADPKRLVRIHGLLKQEGMAAQRSAFFVDGTEDRINGLLDRLAKIMAPKEDDLRAYPIIHPKKVWTNGHNPLADFPVKGFDAGPKCSDIPKKASKNKNWFKRMMGFRR